MSEGPAFGFALDRKSECITFYANKQNPLPRSNMKKAEISLPPVCVQRRSYVSVCGILRQISLVSTKKQEKMVAYKELNPL